MGGMRALPVGRKSADVIAEFRKVSRPRYGCLPRVAESIVDGAHSKRLWVFAMPMRERVGKDEFGQREQAERMLRDATADHI
jgi:hypothetical protein